MFTPFLCQQMLATKKGLHWVGFVFRCEVKGEVRLNASEAINPLWVTIEELNILLTTNPESFFPLQYPVLKTYANEL